MSNRLQRVLTAIVAIPLIVYISMTGGIWFFSLIALLSLLALGEFYRLTAAKGAKPLSVAGAVAGLALQLSFFHPSLREWIVGIFEANGILIPFPSGDQLLVIVLIMSVAVIGIWELFRNDGSPILNLGATLLGIVYVSLFFGTCVGIREMFSRTDLAVANYFLTHGGVTDGKEIYAAGGVMIVSIFAMIWVCDSAAYYAGRAFGKHKLFPRVSPNKSWEGAVAGFLFSVVASIAAKYWVLGFLPLQHAVIIGAVVGAIGQVGDLTESLFKRDAGVKDSSSRIPGHGGVLDRFDSLLFAAPIVYLYLDYIVF